MRGLLLWSRAPWQLGSQAPDSEGPSSHGAGAVVARGVWDLPRPGVEPVSPASAGGFLSAVPRGKADLGAFYVLLTALVFYSAPTSQLWWLLDTPRSLMGKGNGTPLQYSCLENPMDGGAWWAAVQGVVKSQT